MNWEIISYVSLGLFFIISCLGIAIYYKYKKCSAKWKIFVSVFVFMSVLAMPLVDYIRIVKEWENMHFEGIIRDIIITKNHELREYRIQNQNGNSQIILDKLWKLDGFDVGDSVVKRSGEKDVIPSHRHHVFPDK